jgi:hypothetical protein
MVADEARRREVPWRWIGWGAAGALLALPLIAMRFTDEVQWTASDFVVMGLLLGAVGLGLELAVRKSARFAYRLAAGLALLTAFLTVWINAAVGIIGDGEGASRLYGGVLLVALAGAALARFRSNRMAWAMAAAALSQLAVPPLAALMWPDARPLIWRPEVITLTGMFAAMWLLSAAMFRKAGD